VATECFSYYWMFLFDRWCWFGGCIVLAQFVYCRGAINSVGNSTEAFHWWWVVICKCNGLLHCGCIFRRYWQFMWCVTCSGLLCVHVALLQLVEHEAIQGRSQPKKSGGAQGWVRVDPPAAGIEVLTLYI